MVSTPALGVDAPITIVSAEGSVDVKVEVWTAPEKWDAPGMLVEPDAEIAAGVDARATRRVLYRIGVERFVDQVLLGWSISGDRGGWLDLIGIAAGWQQPRFPLSGADVQALNVPTGPAVGRLLSAVESWWVEADFAPDRAACLAELRRRAAGES